MSTAAIHGLVRTTLTNPAEAARQLLALCPARDVLWLGFFLTVVLSTLVQTAASILYPLASPDLQIPFEPVWHELGVSTGALMLSIAAFFLAGRLMGGVARLDDIMCLIIWLQLLQVVAQFAIYIIALVIPLLFSPLVLAMSLYSLYITLHFLNQAHQFNSLGKSFLVVLLSALAAVPFVLFLFPLG